MYSYDYILKFIIYNVDFTEIKHYELLLSIDETTKTNRIDLNYELLLVILRILIFKVKPGSGSNRNILKFILFN